MGGSPSKKRELDQAQEPQNNTLAVVGDSKERSVSLPTSTHQNISTDHQMRQIIPIKNTNRSATISYSQPQYYSSTIQRVPIINKNVPRTVFTEFNDLNSSSQIKTNISNLDASMIEFQNRNPQEIQYSTNMNYQDQIPSRLRITLGQNQGMTGQQQQIQQIVQPLFQKSNTTTPQKQVPKIIQSSTGGNSSQDKSSRMSPYQALRNVVIYDTNTSFNSNNNSGGKGITVTTKLNNSYNQQQIPSIIPNKQTHSITTCNQPNIINHIPITLDLDYQSTLRTTVSQNVPTDNIRVLDFLQRNKGNPSNSVIMMGENNSQLSNQQEGSYINSQQNKSSIQCQQNQRNSVISNESKESEVRKDILMSDNKIIKPQDNILVIDKSNTARITERLTSNSKFKDESCFNESPVQKKQNTSVSQINQQRSVDFEQKQEIQTQQKSQRVSDIPSSAKQINKSATNNQQAYSTNRSQSQTTSNQTSVTKQDSLQNELTQKKQVNNNSQHDKKIIQEETEKKTTSYANGIQNILPIHQQSLSSRQKQKYVLNSPSSKKFPNQSNGKLQDDQVSFMYSATEDQKKYGNSVLQLTHSGNDNYRFGSNNQDGKHNISQTVFQNSSLHGNSGFQVHQNSRTNNFQQKMKSNEDRQLVIKLEDIYKQMENSTIQPDYKPSITYQNKNFIPTITQQIRVFHPSSDLTVLPQRSFSQISSMSALKVSNANLKEERNASNSLLQSDKKVNTMLTTSVTQLPVIQQFYYPITSVKKINHSIDDNNNTFISAQPYSSYWYQRSQSINQNTSHEQSFQQYESGKKEFKQNYYSVDQQRNGGGVLLLKDNSQFLSVQGVQQFKPNNITSIQKPAFNTSPIRSFQLSSQQIKVPSLNTQFVPITKQIQNQQMLQPKQQIKFEKKDPIKSVTLLEQKSIDQLKPQDQILLLNNLQTPSQQTNKIYIKNPFGTSDYLDSRQSIPKVNSQQDIHTQGQNVSASISQRNTDLQTKVKNNDQFSIIQQNDLQAQLIKGFEQEQNKTINGPKVPHVNIAIIPKQIVTQENQNNVKPNESQKGNEQQQEQQITKPIDHSKQNQQFQANTMKLKQKEINHSSLESIAAASSIAKDQSSSCEEFKNLINFGNEKLNLEQSATKNAVRASDYKQQQSNSFTQQSFQPFQVNVNLQEQIQNKLGQINQNVISIKQQNAQNSKNNKEPASHNSQQQQQDQLNNTLNNYQTNSSNANHNNYSFQFNQNNYQSVNNNTTFDFQLTRTDDELIHNQLHTIIDVDNEDSAQQNILQSVPKKRLNPDDNIQIYLNFSSESSLYSSVLSDCNEKSSNHVPLPIKEISQTRQLKNPLITDKGIFINQFNKENNVNSGRNINASINNSQNNSARQKNNNYNQNSNRIPPKGMNNKEQNQGMVRDNTNDRQINRFIQNELNAVTQESYPSDHNPNPNNNNGKISELLLLEAQDNCKKTLHTYQNLIDLEDQRKSPKEFDRDNNEGSSNNLHAKKRFLTQNDQDDEESINHYPEIMNSMQSQSLISNNGVVNGGNHSSTPFNFSKQQIFSSVNSYNLHNSTIIKKVNNQFQALTSLSQHNHTDNERECSYSNLKNALNKEESELFFKYCKKSGALIPIPQSKIEEYQFEKMKQKQYTQIEQQQQQEIQQSNSKTSLQNSSSGIFGLSQNTSQHKRSLSNVPTAAATSANKQQHVNFNNLYNNQYIFNKHNSNLYTDVLERYSGYINKQAREQKSKLQQTYGNVHNNKSSTISKTARRNLRV